MIYTMIITLLKYENKWKGFKILNASEIIEKKLYDQNNFHYKFFI